MDFSHVDGWMVVEGDGSDLTHGERLRLWRALNRARRIRAGELRPEPALRRNLAAPLDSDLAKLRAERMWEASVERLRRCELRLSSSRFRLAISERRLAERRA